MNDRIKELAIESGADWDEKYHWFVSHNTLIKFTELITKDLAELDTHEDVTAPVGQSAYGEAYQDGWIEGVKAYRNAILEYLKEK